jgi:hypothetical protein
MKRFLCLIAALIVRLWSVIVMCVGCDQPGHTDSPKPSRPSVFWTGEDTGYHSTTPNVQLGRDEAVTKQAKPDLRRTQ